MDWVKNAKPGDKVVCIKEVRDSYDEAYVMRVGTIVTFDGIKLATDDFAAFYSVEEGQNFYFVSSFFTPIQHRPTDISIFTDMLKTVPAEPVEA